ncbi:hydantoinase B/oxoprolinase family protein [Falsiroseomonas sp. HW251]|uniref:hydantoinase B/oxoprolinase family protein n=1 Tax=Falsiroseomonas sp. HW251 TaxID=3390998 RepID=UPI003D312A50
MNAIQLGIIWQRLTGLMDEVAQAVVRTSFSTVIRENWDLACSLLDSQGRQIAQSSRSVPSFIGTIAPAARAMLAKFPPSTLDPGDILITNDPWISSGHLNDITMMKPLFRDERIIAFVTSVFHSVDIGGAPSPSARDSYEEGLWIPVSRIVKAGVENAELIELMTENLRIPADTFGDIRAQFAAYGVAERKLRRIMAEEGLEEIDGVSSLILDRSETSLRRSIEAAPDGTYTAEVSADGYDAPLLVRAAVTIAGSDLTVDFAGTSPQVDRPINSVLNYTFAWTAFAVKCLFDPAVPNNSGSFRPVRLTAPAGSILNPIRPAPVWARHLAGHYVPLVLFRALASVRPDRAMADCAAPIWSAYFKGEHSDGRRFVKMYFMAGGLGGRAAMDGLDCRSYPSNIANSPVEVFEAGVPMVIREKALRTSSGGAGRHRGGLGQRITFESLSETPISMTIRHERVRFPAEGLLGGSAGKPGSNQVNGCEIAAKSVTRLEKGDRVTFLTPGGGGLGDPSERSAALIARDLAFGYVEGEPSGE